MRLICGAVLLACLVFITAVAAERIRPWPEADARFRHDPNWLGGDGASSVDLGDGRVLWLFDDSLVTTQPGRDRRTSVMVRNSVATQATRDPSASDARFFWRGGNHPASYFPEQGQSWFWPVSGLVHQGRLTVLLMRVRASRAGLGFAVVGWSAWRADSIRGEPDRWRWRELPIPVERFDAIVGSGGLLVQRDHVVAIAARQSNPHAVMLARWRSDDFDHGRLDAMEWWGGTSRGWIAQARVPTAPVAILRDEPLEFTIHYDDRCAEWLQLRTQGFGAADIELRSAPSLTGPWSSSARLFHPPESDRTDTLVYQAKAHPWLLGDGLVLTYLANANTLDGLVDMRLYTPRFLRIALGCTPHQDSHASRSSAMPARLRSLF